MLHADKLNLEYGLALSLLQLRNKELDHLTNCCFTLAMPAALFAGFAYQGMVQVYMPFDTPDWLATSFYALNAAAMCLLIAATVRTSLVGLMGPALALRGAPGAMHRAVETMGPCFMGAWLYFVVGVMFIYLSCIINLWIQVRELPPPPFFVCSLFPS